MGVAVPPGRGRDRLHDLARLSRMAAVREDLSAQEAVGQPVASPGTHVVGGMRPSLSYQGAGNPSQSRAVGRTDRQQQEVAVVGHRCGPHHDVARTRAPEHSM